MVVKQNPTKDETINMTRQVKPQMKIGINRHT